MNLNYYIIYEYTNIITSAYLILIVLILYYLTSVLIRYVNSINKDYAKTKNEIRSIVSNITNQISYINAKISDLDSEISSISEKILKIEGGKTLSTEHGSGYKLSNKKVEIISAPDKYDITSHELTTTQKIIIEELKKGPRTYKEIQAETNLTREHISRELKKLYELGILERDESKKPFIYKLKEI